MAEKSGFWSGFWLGAIVGGVTSAIVVSLLNKEDESIDTLEPANRRDPSLKDDLQQKIAQLNAAIDAVSKEISAQEEVSSTVQEQ
ncbi:MAG: hypothetical protein ACK4QL_10950 [Pseudanabaenaceae cyanobacterium]